MQSVNRLQIPVLLAFFFGTVPLSAQQNNFLEANRLMQEQKYEEACVLWEELHAAENENALYLERLVDCLVRIDEPERALRLTETELERRPDAVSFRIRRGELLHRTGERERALELWRDIVLEDPPDLSVYFQTGNAMMSRREHEAAADLFLSARDRFGDPTLFSNEILFSFLQSGNPSMAVEELIRTLLEQPGRSGIIRQRLLQLRDPDLFMRTAERIAEKRHRFDTGDRLHRQLLDLQLWLLMETGNYDDALEAAMEYESATEVVTRSLFDTAHQLKAAGEFELAQKAYLYYADSSDQGIRFLALDRTAELFLFRADRYGENRIAGREQYELLSRQAYDLSVRLLDHAPDSGRRERVLIRLAELAFEPLREIEEAKQWLSRLESTVNEELSARRHGLEGKIHLAERQWREARHSFSRAVRHAADEVEQARYRYYLGVTDFLSGEPEYALLQLQTIERSHDSPYANDALRVRIWSNEAERADGEGKAFDRFRATLSEIWSGRFGNAILKLQELPEAGPGGERLCEIALVELGLSIPAARFDTLYSLLDSVNSRNRHSPQREQLLWMQASLAEWLAMRTDRELPPAEKLYEQLIVEFPQGFYAPRIREILRNLERTPS